MTDFQFQAKLNEGAKAEDIVYRFLGTHKQVASVEDVRDIKAWQQKDVDYRVRLHGGQFMNVEAKSDVWIGKSGNLLLEIANVYFTGERVVRPGWAFFSQATWLLMWCPTNQRLYSLTMNALHTGFQSYIKAAGKNLRLSISYSEGKWMTISALVPMQFVNHHQYALHGSSFVLVSK